MTPEQREQDLKAFKKWWSDRSITRIIEPSEVWLAARESLREEMGPTFAEVLKALRSEEAFWCGSSQHTAGEVADWLEQHFKTTAGYRDKGE